MPFLVLRWALRILFTGISLVVLYVGVTFAQVWMASRQDDTSPAAAIVVMGAAQWNGVPSPVLKGRLDHALELYRAGAAPIIVVTGGKQTGDAVTQGYSGFRYLRDQGVPESAIRVEIEGTNSFEELSASAVIVRQAGGGDTVLIVTDPYHALRTESIAGELGLRAHVSPTRAPSTFQEMFRETIAVSIGRVIGYRRLSSFT
ncbi:MAG: YdcF family protein [Acidobacteria bacterium]|nr:YdcF family protein [Acidobacteriota bacterium]